MFNLPVIGGPTKHHKEHKEANLFKNTRISTTRDHEEHKGVNLFINTRISTTREHKGTNLLCIN